MRAKITVVLLILVANSGCLSGVANPIGENTSVETTGQETTTNGEKTKGYLVVEITREVPENVTVVDVSDERVRNVTLLQQTIENVTETNRNDTVNVSGERLHRVQNTLAELPWYSGRDGANGNYIRKNDTVVVVYLKVLT